MKSAHRLLSAFALVALVTGCTATASETAAVFTAQDSSAIVTSGNKWVSSLLARDFDGWGTSITSDVVLYPPNGKQVVGRDAAIAFVKAYPPITKFTIDIAEITGRADVAYDRGTYVTTVTLPTGAVTDTGSFFSVFRRQPDGTWAHSVTMWHSDLPIPTPAAAPATPARNRR